MIVLPEPIVVLGGIGAVGQDISCGGDIRKIG